MLNVIAALSLAGAAASAEEPTQLFEDAKLLYEFYNRTKSGAPPNFEKLAETGELKSLVESAARVAAVANSLVQDPAQMKNVAALLASI